MKQYQIVSESGRLMQPIDERALRSMAVAGLLKPETKLVDVETGEALQVVQVPGMAEILIQAPPKNNVAPIQKSDIDRRNMIVIGVLITLSALWIIFSGIDAQRKMPRDTRTPEEFQRDVDETLARRMDDSIRRSAR